MFNFKIWMLFSGIVVEYWLQVVDEIMVLVGYLNGSYNDVIWCALPWVFNIIVYSIGSTREVDSLLGELIVLMEKRAPLHRGTRPIQEILKDEVIKAIVVLSPLMNFVLIFVFALHHLFIIC
jgi:hypothetical protein